MASARCISCRRRPGEGYSAFGPGDRNDDRNPQQANPRKPRFRSRRMAWSRHAVCQFVRLAGRAVRAGRPDSPRVGKFTHPCGAPDNHLLWSGRPARSTPTAATKHWYPRLDSGILPDQGRRGRSTSRAQMLLIKNDPAYNEQWPRPSCRIGGSTASTSRQSRPRRQRRQASPICPRARRSAWSARPACTSAKAARRHGARRRGHRRWPVDRTNSMGCSLQHERPIDATGTARAPTAGLYDNDDIHAIRIVAQEPTTAATPDACSGTVRTRSATASWARSRCASSAARRRQPV